MLNFERITTGLDVAPLLAALEPLAVYWSDVTLRQSFPGSPHADTECIYLRGPMVTTADPHNEVDSEMYPAARHPSVQAAMDALLERIGLPVAEIGRVMVVRLKAGGSIKRHVDEGAYAERFSRFHVPLRTSPGNTFTVHGEASEIVRMLEGECWWFDHRCEHEVCNDSKADRIHLIFDARMSCLYREH